MGRNLFWREALGRARRAAALACVAAAGCALSCAAVMKEGQAEVIEAELSEGFVPFFPDEAREGSAEAESVGPSMELEGASFFDSAEADSAPEEDALQDSPEGMRSFVFAWLDSSGYVQRDCELGVDGADHELTKGFRERFLREKNLEWLAAVLARGADYRPYIRMRIQELGLPAFIEYLPVIESEFKATARSKKGATGIWQFMENSMKPYLKKTTYTDDRLDPWKATDAALSKLQYNYEMFGDWLLALAAYNCGAGAMAKILKKNPGADFWTLAEKGLLKKQTEQYVPKLLAISDIVMNSAAYGVNLPELEGDWLFTARRGFDYVTIDACVNLSALAKNSGLPADELLRLNPALIKKRTPGFSYELRLPPGTKEDFLSTLEGNGGIAKIALPKYVEHKIVKGDTLYGLARKHKTTVDDLQLINNLGKSSKIVIGQTLLLPILE